MTLKRRSDVTFWEVDGEGVVYDPGSGMGHVLNPTALHILALCDGSHSRSDIENSLVTSFPDERTAISNDVDVALAHFSELGLFEAAA